MNKYIYIFIRWFYGLSVCRFLSRKHPKILMYHRVTPGGDNGSVSLNNFIKQMEFVKKNFNPISLDYLLSRRDDEKKPKNPIVLTFDDGYSDFYEYAFPVLKKLELPATLFITTGFVNQELWLWPDKVKYALTENPKVSNKFNFEEMEFDLTNNIDSVWGCIADYCLTLPDNKKTELIDCLYQEVGLEMPALAPENYRPLTWLEISRMREYGLGVGSHSHSHPVMTKLDDEELNRELFLSKAIIEENLNIKVDTFCYPNGQPLDFDDRVKTFLKSKSYKFAFVAYPGSDPLKNNLEINRYPIANDWIEFEKTVSGFKYLIGKINRV
ncbi:polysaccharide deacetylase family protein [Marinobacter salinexigens]|uniref:Polysaccharide deacetylase family protein n=1 Tax=Marinobacter salinexigens TaxID=2919747 RepID=A0A5B0VK35_9GAMM|nr:polysaccharide deacetylase family protein [Marinobacter salinexigens]KAA1175047.1 polysaccharide deacetylase family protein [Marinobacter salinexigens]